MPADTIRGNLADWFTEQPSAFLPDGWRMATDVEKEALVCRPDDIVFATPSGRFSRLPIWLDEVTRKGSGVRVLTPASEEELARLRAEMVANNEGGVVRWPEGGSDG